jgi:hypothetical protein
MFFLLRKKGGIEENERAYGMSGLKRKRAWRGKAVTAAKVGFRHRHTRFLACFAEARKSAPPPTSSRGCTPAMSVDVRIG